MPDTPRHPSAGTASEASHLSIGEVLGLLLEEFPDVTISKIRFLESQGLIAPERTPSGYRKFFDNDVELLRVILREQRENYLPLRVIKDRISSGEIDPSGEHTVPRGIRNVGPSGRSRVSPADVAAANHGVAPVAADDQTQPAGTPRPSVLGANAAPSGDQATTDHDAVGDTAPMPTTGHRGPSRVHAAAGPPSTSGSAPTPVASGRQPASDSDDSTHVEDTERDADERPPPDPSTPAIPTSDSSQSDEPAGSAPRNEASSVSPQPPTPAQPNPQVTTHARPRSGPAPTSSPDTAGAGETSGAGPSSAQPQLLPGVTLTRDELSAMVGASGDEITQLEEYGLITGRPSAGEHVYDEDAVTVSRIGIQFLRYGVDARHLRAWKTAADREAGIYEQLITPLLRQRNPQGRQQASEQLTHMNQLGGELRAALMAVALSDIDRR